MCGIAGIINKSQTEMTGQLTGMIKALKHRGPDGQQLWIDSTNKVGLAHTRLAIVDLSDAGSQPMRSQSGQLSIVLNGEIYNHKDLRSEIEKSARIRWRGTSDTEVLLVAFELWGVEESLRRCIGMFAFALFDQVSETVTLGRDRMGEKPLYYGSVNNNIVFASELSALTTLPGFQNRISLDGLSLYFQFSSIPEPYTIYEDIYKLPAGHIITYSTRTFSAQMSRYWDLAQIFNQTKESYEDEQQAIDALNELLRSSVQYQMQADVPTGAFLSGGIDSSTIAAIMQSLSSEKISTFTIGFHQQAFNEAEDAGRIARHIGSSHYELYVGEEDLLEVVPQLPSIYTEPFADSSQIPTFLVSKVARQRVTVALSGDAGDELFCGYSRYNWANRTWDWLERIPFKLREPLAHGLSHVPQWAWQCLLYPFSRKKRFDGSIVNLPDKVIKFLPLLRMKTRGELYHRGFMSQGVDEVKKLLLNCSDPRTVFTDNKINCQSFYEQMMSLDLLTYLPNNNLAKVDRAAMSVALETRVPLLDHRIVSFAAKLPLEYKLRNGQNKWILKQVLKKYVPAELFQRPKKGFGVPLDLWIRGPLKNWAGDMLSENVIKRQGYLNPSWVNRKWQEHQTGKRNWSNLLWKVLVFQQWLESQNSSGAEQ